MKQFCCTLLFFLATLTSYAQNFADFFQDKTLRVDYIFTGDANRQAIYEMACVRCPLPSP